MQIYITEVRVPEYFAVFLDYYICFKNLNFIYMHSIIITVVVTEEILRT